MLKEARNPRENEKIKNETALLKDSLETSGRFSVILDAAGELMDSLAFSQFINRGMSSGRHLRFHVGNYYGIPDSLKEKEYPLISLSMLTMSHELALVVLAEQIYRSGTILFGGSYHR
jgi:23S rRNA (pseudouridine1915-N3)-methyltransferase